METNNKPGNWPYIRNFFGMQVDDESMKSCPHAKKELYWHVELKCIQAGSLLGLAVGPIIAAIRGRRTVAALRKGAMNGSMYGMLVGVPVSFAMTYSRMRTVEKTGVDMEYAYYDRAYRLRHNQNQLRVDRASLLLGATGLVIGVAKAVNPLCGTAIGIAAGTVGAGFYNNVINK